MMRGGGRQAEVMRVSGHRTTNTFRRYNIVDVDDTRNALRAAVDYRRKRTQGAKVVPIRKALRIRVG